MARRKTIMIPDVEAVKGKASALFHYFIRHGEDKDARDPRRELMPGVWAPPGRPESFESLEDWLRRG